METHKHCKNSYWDEDNLHQYCKKRKTWVLLSGAPCEYYEKGG